jgi:hypothetical protein
MLEIAQWCVKRVCPFIADGYPSVVDGFAMHNCLIFSWSWAEFFSIPIAL